ncbi:MAG: DegT/DnrJ/EryC1/StrS family aminotransferase [bacterium]
MSAPAPAGQIPVARPSFGKAEEEAVLAVLRSGWVSQGPRVAEFERQFAAYVGAAHAVAVSSCTTALHLALVAAGVKPGDEVLCPSLSFIATANSIAYAGAVPVFVDIDERTYNMDPARIEEAITPRTRAIMPVHQIGLPAAMDEINAIAARRGLLVIEDAACASGSEYKGRRIGAPHSAMACFSFHPRKILVTGEGGMITTADEALAARLRRLRQHAMTVSDLARHSSSRVVAESYDELGYNYRMTDLQAAIGLVQLDRLDDLLAKRRALAARYSERLSALPWLQVPYVPEGSVHNFQSYMVRLREDAPVTRDGLMQAMLDAGIASRRGIMAIHREAPYRSGEWSARLPVTERVTDTAIVLPLFHEMTEEQQDRVIRRAIAD